MHNHIAKIAIAILDTVQDFDLTGRKFTEAELREAVRTAEHAVADINGQHLNSEEFELAFLKVQAAHERGEC